MNPSKRQFFCSITALAAVLLLGGCSSAPGDARTETPAKVDAGPSSGDVTITKQGFEDSGVYGDHSWMVHYTVTNSGTEAADYFVRVSLYDKDGKKIGLSGAVSQHIRPGATVEDRIVSVSKDMTSGTTADISSAEVTEVERVSEK
ncbi:FxLYD domain-containing protein [Streptomyces sp. NPDC006553]|uniref:FxLYD domain-containing protein n=1 Tax=Streptomyces sp. NPDC006553 TaxID=3157180 RepID=UPI0033B1ADD9